YITFSSLMRPPPPPSTLFPYTTLFRSQAVLPKGFIKGSYKINAVACIAFKYKILYTFSIVFAKITDHRQFHAVVREFLKDLSCHPVLQIKKGRAQLFFIKDDFIKPLEVQAAHNNPSSAVWINTSSAITSAICFSPI